MKSKILILTILLIGAGVFAAVSGVFSDKQNTGSDAHTYTNDTYGYAFEYPLSWHEGKNNSADFFQLYNYDVTQATGGHDWPEDHNKIEGAVVDSITNATSSDYPAESISTSSVFVADSQTTRVDIMLHSDNQIRTYYIPLHNETDQYLAVSIYGDPKNFDVIERAIDSFRFN